MPTPRLWMYAALAAAALPSGFNAHDATYSTKDGRRRDVPTGRRSAAPLPNSLLEFRRCINDSECLAFSHENARTSTAHRDDVSRTREPRPELRGDLLHRCAHDRNFLPAHMLGK